MGNSNPRKSAQHSILVALPKGIHKDLKKKAAAEGRSTVGHVRHLITTDVQEGSK